MDGGLSRARFVVDRVSYAGVALPVRVTLDDRANDGATGEGDNVRSNVDAVVGGAGSDRLVGNERPNKLFGRGGNDGRLGGRGRDRLTGGSGADTIRAGPGDDEVSGQGGRDRLYGGANDDVITGGLGPDLLEGGWGRDTLNAYRDGAADRVFGGPEHDAALVDRRRDFWVGVEVLLFR